MGAAAGSIGATVARSLLPDIVGEILSDLAGAAIQTGAGRLVHLADDADRRRINHDLQTAFRDALLEALHDLGGQYCFPRKSRLTAEAGVAFFSRPQGNWLWRNKDPRARQVCETLRHLTREVQGGGLIPPEPRSKAEAVYTYLLVDPPVSRDLRDPFMAEVVVPWIVSPVEEDIPEFFEYMDGTLLDRTLLHLGELLKQRTSAWRAFERIMLQALQAETEKRGAEHQVILARLDKIQGSLAQAQDGDSSSAGQGLIALAELMNKRKVREAVVTFRTDFEATCQQIDLLRHFKHLHDQLHTLQFRCYNPILQEADRFPEDETATQNLLDYEMTMEQIIFDLQEAVSRSSFPETETGWIQVLIKASEALKQALSELDSRQLQRALWLLNRILSVQPSQINTRLNAGARALRLSTLVEALECVAQNLAALELDLEKVSQFNAGVRALIRVDENLASHVKEHDRWQAVDLELRRIEANIGQDLVELEVSWPDLTVMVEPLYRDRRDHWAVSLSRESEALDEAITAGNSRRAMDSFWRFRRQAGLRFYRVDADLKVLCEELRLVGEPLSLVMRMVG
jgi:hypothetical protein